MVRENSKKYSSFSLIFYFPRSSYSTFLKKRQVIQIMMRHFLVGIILALVVSVGALEAANAEKVPSWVKNMAKWFGDGIVSETEFLNAIKYLINNGIIDLESPSKIIVNSKLSTQELIEAGIEQLDTKNNLSALEFFNQALSKDPTNVKALADKGIVLARQGNYKDARALFDKAIELSEQKGEIDYRIVANAGIVLSIYGDPIQAHVYFDKVLENKEIVRQETLVAVLVNKGVTILKQGDPEGSIKYFDQALEIEPDRIGALVNKANALQDLKKLDEAYELFIKAHKLSKDPLSWKPKFVIIK